MRGLIEKGLVAYHDWKTRRKMERVFRRKRDPYGYLSHDHEIKKQSTILSLIAGREYKTALEIGCAEGAFTRRLAPYCDHVFAVDLSKTAIDRARENLKGIENVSLVFSNIRHCRLATKWDLIVISEVLYYLSKGRFLQKEFDLFLSHLGEILKPGGRMVVVHGFGNIRELEIRKSYVRGLMNGGSLRLIKEFVGGEDPNKAKYLVSLLEKGERPMQEKMIGLERIKRLIFATLTTLSPLYGWAHGPGHKPMPNVESRREYTEEDRRNERLERIENSLSRIEAKLSDEKLADKKRIKLEKKREKLLNEQKRLIEK